MGGIHESGAKIGRRNSTRPGHTARVGSAVKVVSAVRVGSAVRVIGGARAGGGPRAMAVMRPRRTAGKRCRNLDSGHPNVGGRNPAHSLAASRNRGGRTPSSWHPVAKCQISLN